MKVLTKIFLVLAFIIMICQVALTIGIHGNRAHFEELAALEEAAVLESQDKLNQARALIRKEEKSLAALEAKNDKQASAAAAKYAELNARKIATQKRSDYLKKVLEAQGNVVNSLASGDIVKKFSAAASTLEEANSSINRDRSDENGRVAKLLEDVQKARTNLATKYEQYRELEFAAFIMQRQLEARVSLRDRYRYASAKLQMEVGDNGPAVANARISRVISPTRVEINRGADDGVERFQYFNVLRSGRVIGTIRVDSLSNRSALAYLQPGSDGASLQVNDVLQRRRFVNAGYNRGSMGGR